MAEFTLLKLQVDDASFSASAPFIGGDEDAGTVESAEQADESGSLFPFLVGFVFLVVVAVAVRKFLGGSDEDGEDDEEFEV